MGPTHCLLLYEYKRMNRLLLVLQLILLLVSAANLLPAPVSVSVISNNFYHVLHWKPGPGTPPGTQYIISRSRTREKEGRKRNSTTTSCNLTLNNSKETYFLKVQASYNQTLSLWSNIVTFKPFKDTKISPPEVSLAGCGNCIKVNISLPKAKIDIQEFYGARFKVSWNKTKEGQLQVCKTQNKSFTLSNLEKGVEYCVKAEWDILLRKDTKPSVMKCTFTSHDEHENGTFLLGAVTAVMILVLITLTMSTYCLYYAGFLCKLPAAVPRAIITVLNEGYILTPERTTPCQISISSERGTQRKHISAISLQATGEANSDVWDDDDDEDDEDKIHIYLDKDRELSSGDGPCQDSGNVPGKSKPAALAYSGRLMVRSSVEVEAPYTDFDQDEDNAVEAEVSLMHRGDQTGVQGQVTGDMDEEVMEEAVESQDLSNVNLFSVTLAAFAEGDEEQEEVKQSTGNSLTDFLKVPTPDHLLTLDSKQILNHTHSQTESDNDTLLLLQTMQTDIVAGYDGRCADILLQHESTEEEEEFSGYLGHR